MSQNYSRWQQHRLNSDNYGIIHRNTEKQLH